MAEMKGEMDAINRWENEGGSVVREASPSDALHARPPLRSRTRRVLRLARKAGIAVVGTSVLIFGVALIVLPGPAVIVIPLGIAILATEFVWARKLLLRLRNLLHQLKVRAQYVLRRQRQQGTVTR